MAKLFVLTYTFLQKEATALVHKHVKRSTVQYSITLLQEPLHQFFIDRIVLHAKVPLLYDVEENHNVVHAIRKALYQQVEAGLI